MSKSDEKKASKKSKKVEDVVAADDTIVEEEPVKKEKTKKEKKDKKEKKAKAEQADETVASEKPAKEKKVKKEDKKANKEDKKEAKAKSSAIKKAAKPAAASTFAVAAGKAAFDPTISSLFANSLGPSKPDLSLPTLGEDESDDGGVNVEEDDEVLSEIDVDSNDDEEDDEKEQTKPAAPVVSDDADKKRKRKRKEDNDDLEGVYMDRLAREEDKEAAKQKADRLSSKRQKRADNPDASSGDEDQDEDDEDNEDDEMADGSDDEDAGTPPPIHESLLPEVDTDLAKSQRTVFLANVSTKAITSKSDEKTLRTHLSSFFSELDPPAKDQPAYKIESLRFRSTAFATAIPKKAAFAKKELMDATTRSTNAYVVYSSPQLSREAARRLNGTTVLDRHIRVDEVAHPAKVDHKRCIFVGNLGFVDDESFIDQANEEEGKGKRNGRKVPSDIEEGLWRTFGTCGTVESVRVVRDSKTRVGKGFAYVQFTDENAVEAALLLNEKKFPPMLPRKLRISRAKAIKRNAKPSTNTTKPPQHTRAAGAGGIYNPKMSGQEASQLGRAGKLLGRAAAAQLRSGDRYAPAAGPAGIRKPESFIFEGHRASSKGGKTGLKLGGKKKGAKPGGRSAKRGAAWKSSGGKN